jgi:hypothetical protein
MRTAVGALCMSYRLNMQEIPSSCMTLFITANKMSSVSVRFQGLHGSPDGSRDVVFIISGDEP